MTKWEKLFKQSIEMNIPVKFAYWSNHSEFFPDAEKPEHDRIVQPVVIGTKQFKSGRTGIFVRAYLLSKYSYSRNKYFDNDFTNKARKPTHWRLYNVSKMRSTTLVPDFPKEKRFLPQQHREFNPQDKFFTTIMYAMSPTTTYSYYFTGKEEASQGAIQIVNKVLKEYKMKFKKPVRYYAISENEEVGFADSKNLWINTVWVDQATPQNLVKGLKQLRKYK